MLHAFFLLLLIPVAVSAAALDDYYLSAFGALPGNALEKAVLATNPAPAKAVRSATPLHHSLTKDWNSLEPATQKVLAKELAAPTISGTAATLLSSGGHFTIHYATSGSDTPQINDYTVNGTSFHGINFYNNSNLTSPADWASKVGDAFEAAYAFYSGNGGLGYHPPANFPIAPFDVYMVDLASQGAYGFTQSSTAAPSAGFPYAFDAYIQIDKDFTNPIFSPGNGTANNTYTPLQSLQVTSVHEFHHAIQYGYNYYFDVWYAEATSTWFENELYPLVKQLYSYVPGWLDNSTSQIDLAQSSSAFNGQAYGRWILNRYLAEAHTSDVVRSFWTNLASVAPVNGQDIPMVPVLNSVLASSYGSTLGDDFFGLTKRIYKRDWTTHSEDSNRIVYSPVQTFSSYPVNAGSGNNSVTLPHYSFAFYKFVPSAALPSLTITPTKTGNIQATVFKQAAGTISEIPANADGSFTVSGFNSLNSATDEVVLLVANTSNADGQSVNFSTDGSSTSVGGASSGGGGGCFIATAAYGSYLHPKVAELRAFRDRYLLTSAPGRLFVALYYRLSPPVARIIAQHEWMRAAVRSLLAPVVLSVEHPREALLAFALVVCGLVWRLSPRRRRQARFIRRTKFIHLA